MNFKTCQYKEFQTEAHGEKQCFKKCFSDFWEVASDLKESIENGAEKYMYRNTGQKFSKLSQSSNTRKQETVNHRKLTLTMTTKDNNKNNLRSSHRRKGMLHT